MFETLLNENQYFGAGLGLFSIGLCAAIARRGGRLALISFKRRYITSLELTSNDRCFNWVLDNIPNYFGKRGPNHLAVGKAQESGEVVLVPSVGLHFIKYNNKWIKVDRKRENVTNFNTGGLFETVTFSTLGTSKQLFIDFINESMRKEAVLHQSRVIIHTPYINEWRPFGTPKAKRPLVSVVLAEGVSNYLYGDIFEFLQSGEWYISRGIPYRRGYLLFGPPGCGKSSFIYALAGEIQHSICLLNLSDGTMTDERMNVLLNAAPPKSIILLEDIDAATSTVEERRNSKRYEGMNLLTLSGLLNALDGVASSEGRLVFMTTNFVDRLDSALVRPGRVDLKKYIGFATDNQLQTMFARFYPNCTSIELNSFLMKLKKFMYPKDDISPAEVQALFMLFKNQPGALINYLNNNRLSSALCK